MGKLIGAGSPWDQEPVEYANAGDGSIVYYKEAWYWGYRTKRWVWDPHPPRLTGDRTLTQITEAEARRIIGEDWLDPHSPGAKVDPEDAYGSKATE